MMRLRLALLLSLFALACSSDPGVTTTDATPPATDAAPPPDAATSLGVGTSCPNGTCPNGLTCLTDAQSQGAFPPEGYCTNVCSSNEQCGLDAFCQALGGGISLCIARCSADVCQDDAHSCVDLSVLIPGSPTDACFPGDRTASDGDPCQNNFGQCNDNSFCNNDPFSAPNGYCMTFDCTLGDDNTCHGGTCFDGGGQNICAVSCTVGDSSPCRTTEGYECIDVFGAGNGQPGVCFFPTATGDPCASDADCAPPAANSAWQCLTGNSFPNGSCSASPCELMPMQGAPNGCSDDAECYDPDANTANDQYCVLACITNAQCRQADGYSCELVDPNNPNGPSGCRLP